MTSLSGKHSDFDIGQGNEIKKVAERGVLARRRGTLASSGIEKHSDTG